MRVTVLYENTAGPRELVYGHGLSLLLEWAGETLLFDVGQDDGFARNARALGIDLRRARALILSHGHYDHGGGLAAFQAMHPAAPIYAQPQAFDGHYAKGADGRLRFIGLSPALRGPRAGAWQGPLPHALLFGDPPRRAPLPASNQTMLRETEGGLAADDFAHEQSLLLFEGDKLALVVGCAHRGIVNIVEQAARLTGRTPNFILGGFHLGDPGTGAVEPEETMRAVAEALDATGALCCTGHCTGNAYAQLQARLGPKLLPLTTGKTYDF